MGTVQSAAHHQTVLHQDLLPHSARKLPERAVLQQALKVLCHVLDQHAPFARAHVFLYQLQQQVQAVARSQQLKQELAAGFLERQDLWQGGVV